MLIALLLSSPSLFPSSSSSKVAGEVGDDGADGADRDEKVVESMEVEVTEHGKHEAADSSTSAEGKDQRDVTDVFSATLRRTSNKAPARTTLVVVPMSLIAQWRDEIERFSDLSVYVYYADKRADVRTLRMHDVVITSYGTLAAEAKQYQAAQQQQKQRSVSQYSLTAA